ncbi:MAG: 3-oxoacyl-ACP synthase, partial [Epsilonproteobacteria bacterium]
MPSINILDYSVRSAQGNLNQTLDAMQKAEVKISSKNISIDGSEIAIPFFTFKEEVAQNQQSVKEAIKSLIEGIVGTLDKEKRASTALIVGTSLVDFNLMQAVKESIEQKSQDSFISQKNSIDSFAKELADEFGLNEYTMTISTACTSSANALLEASNLINSSVVDYAIVVGLEIFSPIMSSGFYSMSLLSQSSPQPFDVKRDGIVLGEAISAILLGRDTSKWSLLGGYSNCNSATITSVSQSGEECVEVMQKALEYTHLDAKDITALKAHGTGSDSNDLAEINAISKVFDNPLIFTALKPYVGHTI